MLESLLHRRDTPVRSGGEEFVVLMPEMVEGEAVRQCEVIRRRIESQEWEAIAQGLSVSVSIGVRGTDDPGALRETLREADEHLYAAKRLGRNRVIGRAGL